MPKPEYTINDFKDYLENDFKDYLENKRVEFNGFRKQGLPFVNKKLVEFGQTLGVFPDVWKVKKNSVKGCTANVYVNAMLSNGKMYFNGHSNSEIVRGQLALLIDGLNMLSPEEIVNECEKHLTEFVKNTDVRFSMTISRANSFGTLFQFMKVRAEKFLVD